MPWCPRCDETFPEGPACPRCSARLISRERDTPEDTLHAVPALRALKVSRRYRRALDRLSGPKVPSSRALVFALILLVFASGFMLGRVGSLGAGQPTVRGLPLAEPLPFDKVKGAVSYVASTRDPFTIAVHDLFSGNVTPQARFSPPVDPNNRSFTRVVSYGRSVAVIVSDGAESFVSFAPHGRPKQGWVPGNDVAWISERELLIRSLDGTVTRWTSDVNAVSTRRVARESGELIQTPGGAVVRNGRTLESASGSKRKIVVPAGTKVVAVASDMVHAVVSEPRVGIWDGAKTIPVPEATGEVLGASFEASGDHAAVLLSEDGQLTLAIVDLRGEAALKPIGRATSCASAPALDAFGSWAYVSTGDGVLHAVEVHGGRIESAKMSGVGCGLAWVDIG